MKSKILIYMLILFSIFLLSIGLTYAYFEFYESGNANAKDVEVSVGLLRVLYTDNVTISGYGIEPGWSSEKTIKIENTGTQKMYYSLVWGDLTNEIINDELVVSGTCTSDIGSCSNIALKPVSDTEDLVTNIGIEMGEEHTYVITILFIETNSVQNYNQNKLFSGKIAVEEYIPPWYDKCTEGSSNLRCKMIYAERGSGLDAYADNVSSTYVTPSTGINFAAVSSNTNGKGLYYTTDLVKTEDSKRVYYYRGAVTNNYLTFGGYCWRIVRTVEDGSIRLRYGGIPTEGVCPQTGTEVSIVQSRFNVMSSDNAHVGYMYGATGSGSYAAAHANTNQSNIKKVLDAWYIGGTTSGQECYNGSSLVNCNFTSLSTKLVNYSSLIADTSYCNDRSIGTGGTISGTVFTELGYGSNNTLYGSLRRIGTNGPTGTSWGSSNASPIYKCPQNIDKFTLKVASGGTSGNGNNTLDYPIGLLTADETVYAGMSYFNPSTSNYLHIGTHYWLMTPGSVYGGPNIISINDAAYLYAYSAGENSNFRVVPAISLKSGASVLSGTGLYNSPYIVQ